MTYVESVTSSTRPAPSPRTGRSLRVALALSAPLAPMAIGLSKLLAPYGPSDDGAAVLSAVAARPGALDLLMWLRLPIVLTLIPGVVATGLAALRAAPRLATAGLLVGVPAWAAALTFPDTDTLARAILATGVARGDGARLYDYLANFSSPALSVAVLFFVVGHIVGTVLLGLALWRSRVVPAPVGIALAVSQPLHFVAFVILTNPPLDFAAYCLTALGFGAAGVALLRRRG